MARGLDFGQVVWPDLCHGAEDDSWRFQATGREPRGVLHIGTKL